MMPALQLLGLATALPLKLVIQMISLAVGMPLQVMLIATLLRGAYRPYPLVFLYMILDFLTTILEIPAAIDYVWDTQLSSNTLPSLYWPVQILMHFMVYCVVMSLIYKASERLKSRHFLRRVLIVGAVLIAAVSFAIHYGPTATERFAWVTPWNRDLNFAAAVLDLALWALLIAHRQTDHTLLMLSGGLGIQFAGQAIGASIQQLAIQNRSKAIGLTGSIITVTAYLLFLYIWLQGLRQANAAEPSSATAPSATKAT